MQISVTEMNENKLEGFYMLSIKKQTISTLEDFPWDQKMKKRVWDLVFKTSIANFNFDLLAEPVKKIVFSSFEDAEIVNTYISWNKDTQVWFDGPVEWACELALKYRHWKE